MGEPPGPVEAFISVGSNIEPEANILAALECLRQKVTITGISTFYRTEPLRRPAQPEFLNGVWRIVTSVEPRPLKFDLLRSIEAALGRVRSEDKFAARTIDLDILLYGENIINDADLQIPDPDLRKRPFLAVPVVELAPEQVLPGTGERLRDLPCAQSSAELRPALKFTQRLKDRLTR